MHNYQHPYYQLWKGMRARCRDTNHISYPNYGARGITVCERWDDFNLFVEDMGERPTGFTLDRIDPLGPYSPDNCEWASTSTQNTNRRTFLGSFKSSNDPMRFITKVNDAYTLQISLGDGNRYRRYNLSLQEALELRADIEMEREMHKLLS